MPLYGTSWSLYGIALAICTSLLCSVSLNQAPRSESMMMKFFRTLVAVATIFALLTSVVFAGQEVQVESDFRTLPTATDCSFLKNPNDYLKSMELHRSAVSMWTETVGNQVRYSPVTEIASSDVVPAPTARRNFID